MSIIMIRCPNTGAEISTGIETDARAFSQLPNILTHSPCSACGLEHPWCKSQAWLDDGDDAFVPADTAA